MPACPEATSPLLYIAPYQASFLLGGLRKRIQISQSCCMGYARARTAHAYLEWIQQQILSVESPFLISSEFLPAYEQSRHRILLPAAVELPAGKWQRFDDSKGEGVPVRQAPRNPQT
jgi:hypothetical protein